MANVKLTVVLPQDLDTALRVAAATQRKPISTIAAEAFQQYLDRQQKPEEVPA